MKPGDPDGRRYPDRRRLFAELLVIVTGVLVALGVDAGWGRLQDREFEAASLESLAVDVANAQSRLARSVRRDSTMIANADRLLSFSVVPADTFVVLVSSLFDTTPFEIRLRTYDELLSTGRVQLLRDRELRLTLTELDAAARVLASYSSQVEVQWAEVARPVLYRSVNWDGIAATSSSGYWGVAGPEYRPPGPDMEVHMSSEFRAAVRDRRTMVSVRSNLFGGPAAKLLLDVGELLAR